MNNLYRHSVAIQSMTTAQLGSGTYDPTYSERIAALECLLQHKTIRTTNEYGRIVYRSIVRLYCDYSSTTAAIAENDRVVVASTGNMAPFEGTYEILGIKDAGGQGRHLEIDMELVS